ncbi:MAG: membrane protein insertase YidC [Rhizobiaceae bacterium]|nr:membrane protein insertase YidC [Rhizobiaceae bacterium]
MDGNNKNTIIALVLSGLVLLAWHFLYFGPKIEAERRQAEISSQRQAEQSAANPGPAEGGVVAGGQQDAAIPGEESETNTPAVSAADNAAGQSGNDAKRISFDTPELIGSINLRGARIDDIKLKNYRQTIDPDSPLIELLSPAGSANAYFAEFGYSRSASAGEVPGPSTVWNASSDTLTANGSVTLDWTNDQGLRFERTISLDDKYMFTIDDKVINATSGPVDVKPYGRVARFGTPVTQGIFVLHEGLIGVLGEDGLQEIDYDDLEEDGQITQASVDAGWLGITDKYWATAMIPGSSFKPRFAFFDRGQKLYQADFVGEARQVAAGSETTYQNRLFAGAKQTEIVDGYDENLGLLNFDLLIDWGWFYFITKPLFHLIHFFNGIFGNFGVAILAATVLIKLIFLPLANMSYASMAKMKKVQPEMTALRERFSDDRMKQQQEMMALYKREKINPAAGCWPILIQIPVFFALYKVLFVTIEMRHAPFFGWIQDLAAPDPTSVFNLFGLLPYEVPAFLLIGVWPLIMGVTMFLQMQMNPAPPDPTQAMIFKWMPVVFTFMLATFPAGLVIYWAWNNTLSIIQQGFIMRRHGAKIELLDNLKGLFSRKSPEKNSDTGKPVDENSEKQEADAPSDEPDTGKAQPKAARKRSSTSGKKPRRRKG